MKSWVGLFALFAIVVLWADGGHADKKFDPVLHSKVLLPVDQRCVPYKDGQPDYDDNRAHPLFAYESPFLIRDERSHTDYWAYINECVDYDPKLGFDQDALRRRETWGNFTVGYEWGPGRWAWGYGAENTVQRSVAAEDHLVTAREQGYRVRLPSLDGVAPWTELAPEKILVGVPAQGGFIDLLGATGYDIHPGNRDDRMEGSVTRIWAHPYRPGPVIGDWMHIADLSKEMSSDDPAFRLLQTISLRNPAFNWNGTDRSGGMGYALQFPNVKLSSLIYLRCENEQAAVEATISNETIYPGDVAIEYSWDGVTWHKQMDYKLQSYQNTQWGDHRDPVRFTLRAPNPWAESTLQVRIVPKGKLAQGQAWKTDDDQLRVSVPACNCDLSVQTPERDGTGQGLLASQYGFPVAVRVTRVGCETPLDVRVTIQYGGSAAGATAHFSPNQTVATLRYYVGPQPCSSQVSVRAVVDPGHEVRENDEGNNASGSLWVDIETCPVEPPPPPSCDPSLPPELCGGSDIFAKVAPAW